MERTFLDEANAAEHAILKLATDWIESREEGPHRDAVKHGIYSAALTLALKHKGG